MSSTTVLLVAPHGDLHAAAMTSVLRRRHGVDAVTMDTRRFPERPGSFRLGEAGCTRTFDGIPLDEVTAVWWRRPHPSVVPPAVHAGDDAYRQAECDAFVQGIAWSVPALWVNEPGAERLAVRKIVQLRLATEAGLAVPETLITNDPVEAAAFIASRPGEVIFKRTGTSRAEFSDTRLVNARELARLPTIRSSPTTFQDYIKGQADLRIVWIGGRAMTVHIDSSAGAGRVDSRLDNSVAFTPFTLPDQEALALGRLMARLGLVFGVIDMRWGVDGQFWFLEVNPQGQFAYLEIKTGMPIFESFSDLLVHGHSADADVVEARAGRV